MEKFRAFVAEHQLFEPHHQLLVAVSGGIDSIVLLHLLQKLGYSCQVAHCNFCLRGTDSDGDEQFVREIAKKMGFPFHSQRFETKAFAQEKGISTQMAAR